MTELWQGAIERVAPLINVGDLHPLDVDLLKVLFTELHLIGERPGQQEIDAYLAELWPGTTPRIRKEYTGIWKTLDRNPTHRFRRLRGRGYPLRRPFLIPDEVVAEHGLVSVGERIASRVMEMHGRMLATVSPDFDLRIVQKLDREALMLENALRVWVVGQVDTAEKARWHPYILAAPLNPSPLFQRSPYCGALWGPDT